MRQKVALDPPGVTCPVHHHRDLPTLLSRDLRGSLVVIDRRDLDAETARRLVDAQPYAVLNAAEFISGRFANLGPEILAAAGIQLLEGERAGVLGISDGGSLRLHDNTLYDGAVVVLDLRPLGLEQVRRRMDAARAGLAAQLETFAHTTSELLRREEDLLLHGSGVPVLRVKVRSRPVVVVGPAARADDLRALRGFIRDEKPVVIAVDGGAEAAASRRVRPDAIVLTGPGTVQPKTLARCREVVLTSEGEAARRRAEQANLPVQGTRTSLAGLDLGLLIAHHAGAKVIVPVGYPSSLDDFVDRGRSAQASNVLTRLRISGTLVEASAVPLLHTGRVRRWHVALALTASAAAACVSVATTPVGQDWTDHVRDVWSSIR